MVLGFLTSFRPSPSYTRVALGSPENEKLAKGFPDHDLPMNSPLWREQRPGRRSTSTRYFIALIIIGITSYQLGAHSGNGKNPLHVSDLLKSKRLARCDPYDNQVNHGSLIISLNISQPALNVYDVPNCQPLDLITALAGNLSEPIDLTFARNKTIMLFGDSIDRDQLDHFCQWVNGTVTMIDSTHPLSPPLPKGEEFPPPWRPNFLNGSNTWPDFIGSRPYVCYVPQVNLRIFSVFHFGFSDPDPSILITNHYYPPLSMNDRFKQIVVPILAKSAELYGTSPNPTLISITPGFWSILRESANDEAERTRRVGAGESIAGVPYAWESRTLAQLKKTESQIKETIELIADTFPKDQTRILYRALHDIKPGHMSIVKNRVQNLDQAGRRAVASLITQAQESVASESNWKRLSAVASNPIKNEQERKKNSAEKQKEAKIRARGFDSRLGVSEWASILRGQELTYFDLIHPLRLPSSWLQGQILLNQLKMIAESIN